jgi:hypothetical protein
MNEQNPITSNVSDVIRQEAKQRALKLIEQNPGCASYVRPEDLDTQALFIPVVSVIKPTADDFYPPIPKVGIMMKPPLVNLMKEKAGISITRTETEKRGEFVYNAHVWGEKRQPDGSMLTEDASYEFDCNIRAELDFLAQPDTYKSDISKRRHLLEFAKFGEQRAVTGAQHSLIHKLAHVARSFRTEGELMRGMIVSRIDRNINGVLADPALRGAALDRMLGATEAVFGTPRQIERTYDAETGEKLAAEPAAVEEGQAPMFPDDEPAAAPELSAKDKLREDLKGYLTQISPEAATPKGTKVHSLIRALIENADSTEKDLSSMVDRCSAYVQKAKEGAAS